MLLPRGEGYQRAMVSHQIQYVYSHPIGYRNSNPLLDTCVYKAEYLDGDTVELIANCIDGAVYKSTDTNSNDFLLFKEILDHRKDAAAAGIRELGNTRKNNRKTENIVEWHKLAQ